MDLVPSKTEQGQVLRPQVWDGSVSNLLPYPSVTITCTVAPITPRAIKGSPNAGVQLPVSALLDKGDGSVPTIVNTITVTGDYSILIGRKWFSLDGSTSDGTFYISGGQ